MRALNSTAPLGLLFVGLCCTLLRRPQRAALVFADSLQVSVRARQCSVVRLAFAVLNEPLRAARPLQLAMGTQRRIGLVATSTDPNATNTRRSSMLGRFGGVGRVRAQLKPRGRAHCACAQRGRNWSAQRGKAVACSARLCWLDTGSQIGARNRPQTRASSSRCFPLRGDGSPRRPPMEVSRKLQANC